MSMQQISTRSFYGRTATVDTSESESEDEASESEDGVEESEHDTDSEFDIGRFEEIDMSSEGDSDGDGEEFFIAKSGRKWMKDCGRQHRARAHNIIREQEGPTADVAQAVETKSDCFKVYVTDDMMQTVVKYTNDEMRRIVGGETDSFKRPVEVEELQAIFGLLFGIGSTKGSGESVHALWKEGPFSRAFFRAVMSRERFKWLIKHLRFDNKDTREVRKQTDKAAAISDVWNSFAQNCSDSYIPGECCTIDEHMVGFRGRCPFRMYLPSKPDKYGIKIFAVVCSHCSYLFNASIYVGKEGNTVTRDLAAKVVLSLSEPINNSGRNLTMDNWFTSVPLAEKLIERGITCVGTMKRNKPDIPAEFLAKRNRAPLTSEFGFEGNKTMVSFVPKKMKAVILLSTMHHDKAVDPDSSKPDIILYYNSTKGLYFAIGDCIQKLCFV